MKKCIAVLLALVLVLSITACTNSTGKGHNQAKEDWHILKGLETEGDVAAVLQVEPRKAGSQNETDDKTD